VSADSFFKLFGLLEVVYVPFSFDEGKSIRVNILFLLITSEACSMPEFFVFTEILDMLH
jgi:hypothetical protein